MLVAGWRNFGGRYFARGLVSSRPTGPGSRSSCRHTKPGKKPLREQQVSRDEQHY